MMNRACFSDGIYLLISKIYKVLKRVILKYFYDDDDNDDDDYNYYNLIYNSNIYIYNITT